MPELNSTAVKTTAAVTTTAVIAYLAYRHFKNKKSYDNSSNKIIIVSSVEDWESYSGEILSQFYKSRVIGLDCEWVTTDQRNPLSLLQLADSSGFCVLIRLSMIPVWFMPTSLIELLENESVIKVGVGINEDVNKLFQDFCIEVKSYIDLRYLVRNLKQLEGENLGLKNLAQVLLNIKMKKCASIRCSDWDLPELSKDQINYAADDAIVAAKLFTAIKQLRSGIFVRPPSFTEDLESFLNLSYKQKNITPNTTVSRNKTKKATKTLYSQPRKKQMYDNCQLIAPDGELLCSCRKGKAEWYIEKGLGTKFKDEPFTVKLNFEPFARPSLDDVFYTKIQTNQCVVCGKTENFHRKFVVPSEYRKYFPDLMKKNLSHDILLLCDQCHMRSNILDQSMRKKLAKLCDAPFSKVSEADDIDLEAARAKSAGMALLKSGDKIPKKRYDELQQRVKDYFNVTEITTEVLNNACNLKATIVENEVIPHGLKVFQYFCKNGGILQLEIMWRQHFLDTMNPKFLPAMWSVHHHHKRLAVLVINRLKTVDFDINILGLSPELIEEAKSYSYCTEDDANRIVKKQ